MSPVAPGRQERDRRQRERTDRNYKHVRLWDPDAFKTSSVLLTRYQEKAMIPNRIHKMQNIRLLQSRQISEQKPCTNYLKIEYLCYQEAKVEAKTIEMPIKTKVGQLCLDLSSFIFACWSKAMNFFSRLLNVYKLNRGLAIILF